jgi:hypothetical protein
MLTLLTYGCLRMPLMAENSQKSATRNPGKFRPSGCVSWLSVTTANTWDGQLIKRKVYFGSQFWSFQSMINYPYCFGLVARQHTMAECVAEQNAYLVARGWKRRRRVGAHYPLWGHTWRPLLRPHLLNALPPPKRTHWGPRLYHRDLWGTVQIQIKHKIEQ